MPSVKKWYYRISSGTEAEFERLGAEGWELVAVPPGAPWTAFFKRPAPPEIRPLITSEDW